MVPPRAHSFQTLTLEVSQPDLLGVATRQVFELRARTRGAEVWRCSEIVGGEMPDVRPEPMYVGRLSSRQVIELLTEIERTGVYEAAACADDDPTCARVTLALTSIGTPPHTVIDAAAAEDATVAQVVRAIHRLVGVAQERSLAAAG